MRLLLLLLLILGPGCVSQRKLRIAQAKFELGVAQYYEGNPEAAIATLREAIETDGRNWRAHNALAVVYVAKGQPELAEGSFRRALQLKKGEAEILVNYGAFLAANGRAPEAVERLEEALDDLDYRNTSAILSNLSFALVESGRADEGRDRAAEAVRRMPTLCQGWFHLGYAEEARGDLDAAVAAYNRQRDECPNDSMGARVRIGCIQLAGPVPEIGVDTLDAVLADAGDSSAAAEARACLRGAGR